MLKVDMHGHVIPVAAFGTAGKYGPEVEEEGGTRTLRSGSMTYTMPEYMLWDRLTDPNARLADMDRRGVDVHIIGGGPVYYLYWIERDLAVNFARAANDAYAEFCKAAPARLYFFANVPLCDVDASRDELDRAAALGARGVSFGDTASGRPIADEYFWPVYEKCAELELPIFMHPMGPGIDQDPGDRVGDASMNFNTSAVWGARGGLLTAETMTVVSMTASGVFDEFPELKVCVPHGGGAIPYQFTRFVLTAQHEPGVSNAKKPLDEYLHHFYFDTVVHDPRARQLLVDVMGPDNVVVGSNYGGWDEFDGFKAIDEMDLSTKDKEKIMGGNSVRIFKLDA
jgi:aminocarboxymuconate-semialdehyde decarboxylase